MVPLPVVFVRNFLAANFTVKFGVDKFVVGDVGHRYFIAPSASFCGGLLKVE